MSIAGVLLILFGIAIAAVIIESFRRREEDTRYEDTNGVEWSLGRMPAGTLWVASDHRFGYGSQSNGRYGTSRATLHAKTKEDLMLAIDDFALAWRLKR